MRALAVGARVEGFTVFRNPVLQAGRFALGSFACGISFVWVPRSFGLWLEVRLVQLWPAGAEYVNAMLCQYSHARFANEARQHCRQWLAGKQPAVGMRWGCIEAACFAVPFLHAALHTSEAAEERSARELKKQSQPAPTKFRMP